MGQWDGLKSRVTAGKLMCYPAYKMRPLHRKKERKNTEPLKDKVLCESERKNTLAFVEIS